MVWYFQCRSFFFCALSICFSLVPVYHAMHFIIEYVCQCMLRRMEHSKRRTIWMKCCSKVIIFDITRFSVFVVWLQYLEFILSCLRHPCCPPEWCLWIWRESGIWSRSWNVIVWITTSPVSGVEVSSKCTMHDGWENIEYRLYLKSWLGD